MITACEPRPAAAPVAEYRELLQLGGYDDDNLTDSDVLDIRASLAELARIALNLTWRAPAA